MKAKIGWSQFRNLLMESAGVEYHKYAGVIATLSELRSAFDDKMNNDMLSYLGILAEKDLDKVKASLFLLMKKGIDFFFCLFRR